MTPTEFRASLKRQGLTQVKFRHLVYASESMVSRWANGAHRVPGGVQAFLELREGLIHPLEQLELDATALLRYCGTRGLTHKQGRRAIMEYLRYKENAPARMNRIAFLLRKAAKAKEWGL